MDASPCGAGSDTESGCDGCRLFVVLRLDTRSSSVNWLGRFAFHSEFTVMHTNSPTKPGGQGRGRSMKTSLPLLCAVLWVACSMEHTYRSDQPVTREEAGKTLCRSLPASAADVYYLFYAGGLQDLESYLRFHVDPTKADQAIDELIAENNRTMKRSLPYVRSSLPPKVVTPHVDSASRFKTISWWQPQSIQHGYFRGEEQSYALSIWYDADKALIYVYQND